MYIEPLWKVTCNLFSAYQKKINIDPDDVAIGAPPGLPVADGEFRCP